MPKGNLLLGRGPRKYKAPYVTQFGVVDWQTVMKEFTKMSDPHRKKKFLQDKIAAIQSTLVKFNQSAMLKFGLRGKETRNIRHLRSLLARCQELGAALSS